MKEFKEYIVEKLHLNDKINIKKSPIEIGERGLVLYPSGNTGTLFPVAISDINNDYIEVLYYSDTKLDVEFEPDTSENTHEIAKALPSSNNGFLLLYNNEESLKNIDNIIKTKKWKFDDYVTIISIRETSEIFGDRDERLLLLKKWLLDNDKS